MAYGLTVAELVERIAAHGVDVHEDTLRNIELGHKRASPPLLAAWANALRLSPLDVWQPRDDAEAIRDEEGAA